MGIKIEQGKSLKLDDKSYLGQMIYHGSAYAYPLTRELTNNEQIYGGYVDTISCDLYNKSGQGYTGGYKIPKSGYYLVSASVGLYECRYAEHYRSYIRRWYGSGGSSAKDFTIGKTISPIAFWSDDFGINDLPITQSNSYVIYCEINDSLRVYVVRNSYYSTKYYNSLGTNSEYEANNNTRPSFNFEIRVALLNIAP